MFAVHVYEASALLKASGLPPRYKAPARLWLDALLDRPRRVSYGRLSRLLLGAVVHARLTAAGDLRRAREAAGLTRKELARAVGRKVGYVAAAERGEAKLDPVYWQQVRALQKGRL